MIVIHFFVREEKRGLKRLMYESSATEGLDPVSSGVEELMEVKASMSPRRIIDAAKSLMKTLHPELEFADELTNNTNGGARPFSFDLTFRPRKSLLDKLGITGK